MAAAVFDEALAAPALYADPYPVFREMRDEQPVYWSERFNSWLVTRYADVVIGLRDRRLSGRRTSTFIDQQLPPDMQDLVAPLKRQLESFIGFTDPPDHTRLRKLVTAAFTSRVAEAARPRIQAVVDQLIDRVVESGSMDLIRDVAFSAPPLSSPSSWASRPPTAIVSNAGRMTSCRSSPQASSRSRSLRRRKMACGKCGRT